MKKIIQFITKIAELLVKLAELLKIFRKNPDEKTAKKIRSLREKIKDYRKK